MYDLQKATIQVAARWPVGSMVVVTEGTTLPGGPRVALNFGAALNPRVHFVTDPAAQGFWLHGLSFNGQRVGPVWIPYSALWVVQDVLMGSDDARQAVTFPLVAQAFEKAPPPRPALTLLQGGKQ